MSLLPTIKKKFFFFDKARQSPYLSLTRMRRYDPDMSQGRSNQYLLAVLMTTSESYDLLHPVCKWGTCGLCEEEARQLVGSQITGKKIWIPSIRLQVLSPSSPPVPWLSPSIPSQTIWHQLSPQTPSPFLHWLLLSRDTRQYHCVFSEQKILFCNIGCVSSHCISSVSWVTSKPLENWFTSISSFTTILCSGLCPHLSVKLSHCRWCTSNSRVSKSDFHPDSSPA